MFKVNFVKGGKIAKFYDHIKNKDILKESYLELEEENYEKLNAYQLKGTIIHGNINKDFNSINYFNSFNTSHHYPNNLPLENYILKLQSKNEIIDIYKNGIYFPPYNFILENDDFSDLYLGAFINSKVISYYLNRFNCFKENFFSSNIAQLIDLIKDEFEDGYYEGVIDNLVLLIEYEIKAKYGLNRIYNNSQTLLTAKTIKKVLSEVFFNVGANDLYFKYIENAYFPDDINTVDDLNSFTDAVNLLFIYDLVSTVLGKI